MSIDSSTRIETEAGPHSPDVPGKFAFGSNWSKYLRSMNDARVAAAEESLARWLTPSGLAGKRVLDAGCGSGLFSTAAHRQGAEVWSIDVDPDSIACAEAMRQRYGSEQPQWEVQTGSVLDPAFLEGLGRFDLVYSWGVVHHTGDMWRAIDLLQQRVAPGGLLWLAIYNDQQVTSRIWRRIKRGYNQLPGWLRTPYVAVIGGAWMAWRLTLRLAATAAATLARLLTLRDPLKPAKSMYSDAFRSQRQRGMHWWYDLVDWIGGWPFEVAKPEEVFRFLRDRGFELQELSTCGGGLGCNEYLFRRKD